MKRLLQYYQDYKKEKVLANSKDSRIFFKKDSKETKLFIQESNSKQKYILKRGYKGSFLSINTFLVNWSIKKEKEKIECELFQILKGIAKKKYFTQKLNNFSSQYFHKKQNYLIKYTYPMLIKNEFIFLNLKIFSKKINQYYQRKNIPIQYTEKSIQYFFKKMTLLNLFKTIKVYSKHSKNSTSTYIGTLYYINKIPSSKPYDDQLPINNKKKQLFQQNILNLFDLYIHIEGEDRELFEKHLLVSSTIHSQNQFLLRIQAAFLSPTRYKYQPFNKYFENFFLPINDPLKSKEDRIKEPKKNILNSIPVQLRGKLAKIFLYKKINKMDLKEPYKKDLKKVLWFILERKYIYQTYNWIAKKLSLTRNKIKHCIRQLCQYQILYSEYIQGCGNFISLSTLAFSDLKRRIPKKYRKKKYLYDRFNFFKKQLKNGIRSFQNYIYQEFLKIGNTLGFFKFYPRIQNPIPKR